MKTLTSKSLLTALLALLSVGLSHGALALFDGLNLLVPDGNPVGLTTTGVVSGESGTLSTISVALTLSGGYNGDLYASLVAPDGSTAVVLLNQPGVTPEDPFGYGGSGYDVTFLSTAPTNIQTTPEPDGQVFTGSYQPAGNLGAFTGVSPNGTWTLFVADVSDGAQSTLTGWSLNITTIPEPSAALLALGALGAAAWPRRRR